MNMSYSDTIVTKDIIDDIIITEDAIIDDIITNEIILIDNNLETDNVLNIDNISKANNDVITMKERKQRIIKLKAEIKKEEALLKQSMKKERNNQLIAFGVLVEEIFKSCSEADRRKWIETPKEYLDDTYCRRVLAGFERLKRLL